MELIDAFMKIDKDFFLFFEEFLHISHLNFWFISFSKILKRIQSEISAVATRRLRCVDSGGFALKQK